MEVEKLFFMTLFFFFFGPSTCEIAACFICLVGKQERQAAGKEESQYKAVKVNQVFRLSEMGRVQKKK